MKQGLFSRRKLGISGAFTVLLAGVAASPALADPGQSGNAPCAPPSLSQPFASAADSNSYMLAPGQTPGNFDATGWQLTGGAKIVNTQLPDGHTSQVLDLPSGSQAVSPTFCIQSDFPTARTMINDVTGNDGVEVYVSNNRTGESPVNTGELNPSQTGWAASPAFDVDPSSAPGQQHVQFTFVASGASSEYQIYNFYVDPRMCR